MISMKRDGRYLQNDDVCPSLSKTTMTPISWERTFYKMNDVISSVPEDLKRSLAKLLDRKKEPNWKTFVAKTPKNIYAFSKGEYETLRLNILKADGSPTLQLIEKLGKKNVQVCHFIDILESLEKDENIYKALDLFMGEPPSIVVQPPPEIQLTIGDDVVVRCEAVGKQPMLYQWFKEDQPLKEETNNELHLFKVTPMNEGLYICRVANGRGYQFSRWIRVVVEKTQPEKVEEERKPVLDIVENIPPEVVVPTCEITRSDFCQPSVYPESVTLFCGSLLSLSCDRSSDPAARFQWLRDEEEIPGATFPDLVISPVSEDHEGTYTCRVYNNIGTVNTRSANVRVTKEKTKERKIPKKIPEEPQGVCDKVALLIGNRDYDRCDKLGKLYHPTNDVRDIAGILQSIGFKVISLVNLRLNEMRDALRLFAELLDPGVYAVFYFAGHGFESGGKSYLMPINANEKYECSKSLPANEVLQIMQDKEAKLKVLLIDCCRTTPGNQGMRDFHDPILSGGLNAEQENVVIAFGCCSQGRVFEHRLKRNGYFAMHLLEYLGDHEKNVEQVLLEVAKGVRKEEIYDSFTGHIQMVYRHSSLAENWCLCDDVIANKERSSQAIQWQKGHELPTSPVTVYDQDNVIVTLRFDAEFSNVLVIRALIDTDDDDVILDPGRQPLQFQLPENKIINDVCVEELSKGDENMPEKYSEEETVIKLSNLQRLEGQLSLKLKVSYITGNNRLINDIVYYEFKDRPLYARLV